MTNAWYLKKSDGTIFGPVPLTDLQLWAADGRVAPDDLLSPDRAKWTPAPRLESLSMDCVIKFRDGTTYGPLHRRAIGELVMEGHVAPDEPVLDKVTDKIHPASALVIRSLLEQPASSPDGSSLENAIAQVESLTAERDALASEKEDLNRRLAELETRHSQEDENQKNTQGALSAEVDALKQRIQDMSAQAKAREQDAEQAGTTFKALQDELDGKATAWEAEREGWSREKAGLLQRISELEEARDTSRVAEDERQQQVSEATVQIEQRVEELTARCELLEQKNKQAEKELVAVRAESSQRTESESENKLKSRIQILEKTIQELRKESSDDQKAVPVAMNTAVRTALARAQRQYVHAPRKTPAGKRSVPPANATPLRGPRVYSSPTPPPRRAGRP